MKVSPTYQRSAFGHVVERSMYNCELDGELVYLTIQTERDSIEIRCSPEWALRFADSVKKQAEECLKENTRSG